MTLQRLWSGSRRLSATEAVDGIRVDSIPSVGGRRFFLAPEILKWAAGQAVIHVHAIDFFVDFRLFAPMAPARKRVTISNGVEEAFFRVRKAADPGLLVMVGRLSERKGVDRAIDLLPRIREAAC